MPITERILRLGDLLAQAGEMAAGDMAGFVGEHADDLVRRLGVHERADIDEDLLPVGHEGVEGAVVDEDDLGRLGVDAGGAEDRRRIVAQELLGLGVAHDREPSARLACAGSGAATKRAAAGARSRRRGRGAAGRIWHRHRG